MREGVLQTMDDKTRLFFEDLRESNSPLATWEFKNLMAGSVEVLAAVPNLGKFSWTYCNPPTCPSHEKGRNLVKLSKVGPDARVPMAFTCMFIISEMRTNGLYYIRIPTIATKK
jgi:hypothetical protein